VTITQCNYNEASLRR